MKMLFRAAIALLALSLCAPVPAQITGVEIFAPAGKIPAQAIYCDDGTGHTTSCSLGGGGGGGGATTIADGADIAEGTRADSAWSGTGNATSIALGKAFYNATIAMSAKLPSSLGAKTSANSLSFTPASDATFTMALPTGAATSAKQDSLLTALGSPFQAGGSIGNTAFAISGTLPAFATPPAVTANAGEAHFGEVGGKAILAPANFTTPAGTTAYASGNLIANSATAGSVTPLSFQACRVAAGTGMARRVRLKTPDTGFAGTTVRMHFHQLSPTYTNGDHAAWLTTESNYLGAMDVTFDKTFSDVVKGIGVPNTGSEINFDCATGSQLIYAEIEARGAITPQGAKTMTAVLEVLAN